MKIKEFKIDSKKKDLKALQRDLIDKEKDYFNDITHESIREKKNPAKIKRRRKEIAILKTIIREKIAESLTK